MLSAPNGEIDRRSTDDNDCRDENPERHIRLV
jgi:hypothetical protein